MPESTIWLSSDLHFNHNKDFIYKARGFNSIEEMNQSIITNFNSLIKPNDTLYLLGDIIMGEAEEGIRLLQQINGIKILVIGNHDNTRRITSMQENNLFKSYNVALLMKYKKYQVYLSHFPTLFGNYDKGKYAGLYAHTHQTTQWDNEWQLPTMYNVGVDAHNCYPVLIDDALAAIRDKVQETKEERNIVYGRF